VFVKKKVQFYDFFYIISMNKYSYVVLDDDSIKNGGTSLTLNSILEQKLNECYFINASNLSEEEIEKNKNKTWIIGNIHSFLTDKKVNLLIYILENLSFVKIEFDYNFCVYRGEIPHRLLADQECNCPHGRNGHPALSKIYDLICKKTKHIFFMSERQRCIFSCHLPILKFEKTSILSSCFSKKTIERMLQLKQNPKNKKFAILSGFGGWHSQAKGTEEAKNFCEANKINYDILPTQDHENHLALLSQYEGLVFLPIIHDTCPRCIIEAKIMGLKVITNINSQHITEEWWDEEEKLLEYLKERSSVFWQKIKSIYE